MKFLFLDRDGVINEDFGYVHRTSDIVYVDNVFDMIKRFADNGYEIAIVTNQSGVGRGYFSETEYREVMNKVVFDIQSHLHHKKVIRVAFCPHAPWDFCSCRKPATGLFLNIQNKEAKKIDWQNSILVGDKQSDMMAGIKIGIGNLYLFSKKQGNITTTNTMNWMYVDSLDKVLVPTDAVKDKCQ